VVVRVVIVGALRPDEGSLDSVAAAVRYGVEVTQAVPGASPWHLRPVAGWKKPIWLPDWAHLSWMAWPQIVWMLSKELVRRLRRAELFPAWSGVRAAMDLQVLTATKADLIHFDCRAAAGRYANLSTLLGLPCVVTCGCDEIEAAQGPPVQGRYPPGPLPDLGLATAVHCASLALASAVEAMGVAKEKVRVIRPPVDTERFKVADQLAHEGVLRLLYVGPFSWRQGLEYVLLGVRKALDGGAQLRFRMLGAGPDRQRIQFCVLDLGIGDAVTLAEAADGVQTRAALDHPGGHEPRTDSDRE
jgi:glycosyltransferase involved in cell wall biosynthesis